MADRTDSSGLVSGADEDGLVTVTVTADRAHVVDVALAAGWRRVLPSADLAPAVLRAFHAAQAAAIARQLEHVDTTVPPPSGAEDDAPAPEYVRALVYTVLDQLDGYAERVARVRAARFDVDSPKRAVTVRTSGGLPSSVTVDPGWARRAPAADLAREIRAAFAAAQSRAEELAAEAGGPTREMAELSALARDPARLVGLVGMRGTAVRS